MLGIVAYTLKVVSTILMCEYCISDILQLEHVDNILVVIIESKFLEKNI